MTFPARAREPCTLPGMGRQCQIPLIHQHHHHHHYAGKPPSMRAQTLTTDMFCTPFSTSKPSSRMWPWATKYWSQTAMPIVTKRVSQCHDSGGCETLTVLGGNECLEGLHSGILRQLDNALARSVDEQLHCLSKHKQKMNHAMHQQICTCYGTACGQHKNRCGNK